MFICSKTSENALYVMKIVETKHFVVLVVFQVNYAVSLCLNKSVLQLFQMKRLIIIFDSLWHLCIAGSAANIATKHST